MEEDRGSKYKTLDIDFLKSVLEYREDVGELFWKVTRSQNARKGSAAGTDHNSGYRAVHLCGKIYLSHRLIWAIMYGNWPINYIDHIDGNKKNNKLENLREASKSQNCQNSRVRKDSTSGSKGVNWHTRKKKWTVRVQANKARKFIGYFDTFEEATIAAKMAQEELHQDLCSNR